MFYEDEDLIPLEDPIGPDEGELRIIRSGRWLLSSSLCRSAGRMMGTPEYREHHIGFRVAYPEITPP
jgi:formylglycine-generating enzyme required for sulfatase activity